jgi:transposase-like protein
MKERKMPRRRISEEKVIYALKRLEAGVKGLEVCRESGVSEQTLYNWKRDARQGLCQYFGSDHRAFAGRNFTA